MRSMDFEALPPATPTQVPTYLKLCVDLASLDTDAIVDTTFSTAADNLKQTAKILAGYAPGSSSKEAKAAITAFDGAFKRASSNLGRRPDSMSEVMDLATRVHALYFNSTI